jgi:hypothetical protein
MKPETPEREPPAKRRRRLIESIRLPQVSGKASAAWLVACFVLTAVLIPMAVRRPLWVDFEIVLAVWWVLWAGLLTRLLYLGVQVSDDHKLAGPRRWFSKDAQPARGGGSRTDWVDWFPSGDGEGCLWAVGIVVALFLLGFAAWFLVEVALPLIAFVLYLVARGMLAHGVNDRHHCRGSLARSLGYGVLWATVYTAPVAGLVWSVHRLHGPQPAPRAITPTPSLGAACPLDRILHEGRVGRCACSISTASAALAAT